MKNRFAPFADPRAERRPFPVERRHLLRVVLLCLLALASASARAQAQQGKPSKPGLIQDDFPFQGACVGASYPSNNVAMKGLAIHLGPPNTASALFDTELLRMAAGWTGGFITTHGVAFDGAHGAHPQIQGVQAFGTSQSPGWADANGRFTDPRPEPFGPLPQSWCRWDGLHLSGSNVVLNYTVHGVAIAEEPGARFASGETVFLRTFKTQRARVALTALIAEASDASWAKKEGSLVLTAGTNITRVGLAGAPKGVELDADASGRALLRIAKGTPAANFTVCLWNSASQEVFAALKTRPPVMDEFGKGGPRRWPETVTTRGVLDTSVTPDKAYATDSLTAPTDNPWKRRVRFAGFDFFADGKRAAVCTHDGDIWIVSGIDDKLERLEWRRFASGQYETLGLVIVNDVIYTSGRDQITRYRDLNGDGEADFYENFNNQQMSTEGFHEFLFDLQTDRAGNFYFAKANPVNSGGGGFGNQKAAKGNGTVCSHSGCLFKLSKDGKRLETYATGFRAPNGIGVSPEGQVTSSDNEGTWVPTTPIHWIARGQFCGVVNSLTPKETAARFVPPLCWLAKSYDNSGGGQIWVTSDKWGPFGKEMLHESYGQSSLFLVMKQDLPGGKHQGGVVKFPLRFTSSVMRARFHKQDGQLYVCGLSEWQSNAGRVTGFDRVRYTGKPVYSVRALSVDKAGVHLTFTKPLARESAEDLQNFSAKRWNYERAEHYGSPEFSVADPAKKGRDSVNVTEAKLSQDGLTLTVRIEDLKPVMQQTLKFNLKAADGTPISQEIMHTIHEIP
ncbi:MAG: hypothetical protein HYR88_09620 [Verrucomicrobia bacterium]|nr:hypothetical protein [Verrucomicrobiota bacterium]MBI3867942.1 hypothetical protein [Verrucomicrobiota bacterium]